MNTVDNGLRYRLEIEGFHAGEGGFATPTDSQRAGGADLVVAFRPNIKRVKLAEGMIADTANGRYRIVKVLPGSAGLVNCYLTDA